MNPSSPSDYIVTGNPDAAQAAPTLAAAWAALHDVIAAHPGIPLEEAARVAVHASGCRPLTARRLVMAAERQGLLVVRRVTVPDARRPRLFLELSAQARQAIPARRAQDTDQGVVDRPGTLVRLRAWLGLPAAAQPALQRNLHRAHPLTLTMARRGDMRGQVTVRGWGDTPSGRGRGQSRGMRRVLSPLTSSNATASPGGAR